ncbi:recombinase family protein [Planctomycetes bacterium K23_9]|uniref:Resolvase/invertase-type recombinase catalytic domain-containing protein n=1 Tax=Stieleria marina TaxID=1930275 RepID=A0A517NXH9_9BACT|nr:hypothetical protein K239x_38270 [Planctomycetes bacterium K23_9]
MLADWCEQGLRPVSVTQATDISGTQGRVFAGLLMGLAEMELDAIKERQAIGIAAAMKRGVYVDGRPMGSTKATSPPKSKTGQTRKPAKPANRDLKPPPRTKPPKSVTNTGWF